MFKTNMFSIKKGNHYEGTVYQPQLKTKPSVMNAIRFIDNIVNGVPVEVVDSYSLFDQYAFDKLIEKENIENLKFNKCLFKGVTWGGIIKGWSFVGCKFVDCDFSEIIAEDIEASCCEIKGCTFGCATISSKNIDLITITDSDFSHAKYSGVIYGSKCEDCTFDDMNFVEACINRNFFKKCSFKDAILNNTHLRNCSFKNIITEGILFLLPGMKKEELEQYKKSCILAMVGGDDIA